MQALTNKLRLATVGALAALGLAFGAAPVDASAAGTLPGDTPVPFWPYETGTPVGTSETYTEMGDDGSYYDPSIGRRVVPAERAVDRIVDDWFRDAAKAAAPGPERMVDDWFRDRPTLTAPTTNPGLVDDSRGRGRVGMAQSNLDGFDWGDFGLGAAAMLCLTLVLAGCGLGALTVRHRGGHLKTS